MSGAGEHLISSTSQGSGFISMLTFSVITPTLNRGDYIADAIRSVRAQGIPALEHIVVDGGSTDDTLKVLGGFSKLTVISEPDKGLYDALNKGLKIASGDIIVLLNSDDQLMPGAFEIAKTVFDAQPNIEMVCGKVWLQNLENRADCIEIGSPSMQALNPEYIISGPTLTNSRFIRRHVFQKVGAFDLGYPIAADRDFLGRCLLAKTSVALTSEPLYQYGVHAGSLTFSGEKADALLLDEYCQLALDRYRSAQSRDARTLYGRWAAWALFYRMLRFPVRSSAMVAYWRFMLNNLRAMLPLVEQIYWHLRSRKERRGVKVAGGRRA